MVTTQLTLLRPLRPLAALLASANSYHQSLERQESLLLALHFVSHSPLSPSTPRPLGIHHSSLSPLSPSQSQASRQTHLASQPPQAILAHPSLFPRYSSSRQAIVHSLLHFTDLALLVYILCGKLSFSSPRNTQLRFAHIFWVIIIILLRAIKPLTKRINRLFQKQSM